MPESKQQDGGMKRRQWLVVLVCFVVVALVAPPLDAWVNEKVTAWMGPIVSPIVDTMVVTRPNGERINESRAEQLCNNEISRQRGSWQSKHRTVTAILSEDKNYWGLTVAVTPSRTGRPNRSEIWSCRIRGDTTEIRVQQIN